MAFTLPVWLTVVLVLYVVGAPALFFYIGYHSGKDEERAIQHRREKEKVG